VRRIATTEFFAILVLLLHGACITDDLDAEAVDVGVLEQEIINGDACSEADNPTAVAIILEGTVDLPDNDPPVVNKRVRTVFCTGTLIAPDVVLAAAHCQYGWFKTGVEGSVTDQTFYVTFRADLGYLASLGLEEPLPSLPEDAVEVTSWVHNSGFHPDMIFSLAPGLGNLYDIGVFYLAEPVTDVEPAVVIASDEASQVDASEPVTIVGWGSQVADTSGYDDPSEYRGQKICAQSYINEIAAYEMQVGGSGDSARKCHGDSGGPTYLTVTTEYPRSKRVVGITSHTYDSADCEKGAVDTRVDAWLTWLDDEMRSACADGSRAWCEFPGILPPDYVYESEEEPPGDGGGCGVGRGNGSPVGLLLLLALAIPILPLRRRRFVRCAQ